MNTKEVKPESLEPSQPLLPATINTITRENGTMNGEPIAFLLNDKMDPVSGTFIGEYQVFSAPGTTPAAVPAWLQTKVWERKAERLKDFNPGPPDKPPSIFELAARNLTVSATVRSTLNDFYVRTVSIRGTNSQIAINTVFSGRSEGQLRVQSGESRTRFQPAGVGLIKFYTKHDFGDGESMSDEGLIRLDGNPRGQLDRDITMVLVLEVREENSDNSDGCLSGSYEGRIELIS